MPAVDPVTLRLMRQPGVLVVELHRPECRNAMSLAMVDELTAILRAAEADASVRLLVLRGADGHFCAGADLRDMVAARARLAEDPEAIAKLNAKFGQLCVAFAASPLAVVAALEGTVMGGGLGLACAADVAIAERGARFRLPETSLGVVPAQIVPVLLERIGYAQAKRLAVSGGTLDGEAAFAMGLVHGVHAGREALDAALAQIVGDILRCAPGAIAATKALLAAARWQAPAAMVDAAARVFAEAALGEEGIEGVRSFIEKRPPAWAIA